MDLFENFYYIRELTKLRRSSFFLKKPEFTLINAEKLTLKLKKWRKKVVEFTISPTYTSK